ncbi:MAG: hypothetical protein ACTHJQ_01500 [Rhizobiaceae bacterium]
MARIENLDTDNRGSIRDAVRLAVEYWPNAHLGTYSVHQDMRSAFRMIRNHVDAGWPIQAAIGQVEADAYRHMDM